MILNLSLFATRNDLLPGLLEIERWNRLAYVPAGMRLEPELEVFGCSTSIPHLGYESCADSIGARNLLVFQPPCEVWMRIVKQRFGGERYNIEHTLNPTSLRLCPGGIYDNRILLEGFVEAGPASPQQDVLGELFGTHLLLGFKKISRWWVGPEASQLLYDGFRLGASARRDPKYDLKPKRQAPVRASVLTAPNPSKVGQRAAGFGGRPVPSQELAALLVPGAQLAGAKLSNLSMPAVDLSGANLKGADLSESELSGAVLEGTCLCGANLTGTVLHSASLTRADLSHARLERTILIFSRLEGVDLTNTELSSSLLMKARYDHSTKWPAGFDPRGDLLTREDFIIVHLD